MADSLEMLWDMVSVNGPKVSQLWEVDKMSAARERAEALLSPYPGWDSREQRVIRELVDEITRLKTKNTAAIIALETSYTAAIAEARQQAARECASRVKHLGAYQFIDWINKHFGMMYDWKFKPEDDGK